MRSTEMKTHLVIPDSHAKPDVVNHRFELLGRLIVDIQPDVIVNIGDMADMESLCSYDKGTKSFEGRRYKADVDAVIDAQTRMFLATKIHNENQRRNKKKKYTPELHMCLGNHENRINRVVEHQPELDGTIGVEDLQYAEFGWVVHPFMSPVSIDGILYSHYFTSGIMGKAISGVHIGHTLIQKKFKSCTQGHSHILDYKLATAGDGTRLQGLSVGCFLEKDQYESYAGEESNAMWWRGVVVKHITTNGYDPEFISIERLEEMYG
jgi:hypothetical protein